MSDKPKGPPPSERAFVCGVTGSGKTEFLRRAFLSRPKRLLIVDQTGEWSERHPDLPLAYGAPDAIELLQMHTREENWRLIVVLTQEELEILTAKMLVPMPNPRKGYVSGIGGMAIYLDEVDVLCPNSRTSSTLQHLWRRGRHAGLSVYAATQRPGNVSKEVTSQCRWLAILRQHEVNDIAYLRRSLGKGMADKILAYVNANDYAVVLFDTIKRKATFLDKNQKVVKVVGSEESFGSSKQLDLQGDDQ